MNNLQVAAELAALITEEMFGFSPELKQDGTESYTKEGQDYFNRIYDTILNYLSKNNLPAFNIGTQNANKVINIGNITNFND